MCGTFFYCIGEGNERLETTFVLFFLDFLDFVFFFQITKPEMLSKPGINPKKLYSSLMGNPP